MRPVPTRGCRILTQAIRREASVSTWHARGPLLAVTAAARPRTRDTRLYYYAGDTMPGQTNGQALDLFGGQWFVLTPEGKRVG